MKEIPILMSTPMVQAILQGRKTQTRRLLKCKRIPTQDIVSVHPDGAGVGWIAWAGRSVSAEETRMVYPGEQGFKCPYGRPGDLLWVRENWQLKGWDFEEGTMTVKQLKAYMGMRLKEERQKAGLKQEDVGNVIKLSRVSILIMESGRHSPTPFKLLALCRLFNCTLNDIFPPVEAIKYKIEEKTVTVKRKVKRIKIIK